MRESSRSGLGLPHAGQYAEVAGISRLQVVQVDTFEVFPSYS